MPRWYCTRPALLLALVPVLRLLPQRVFEVLGRWPFVGTLLYLLYRLSILLVGQPLYYRLYTLALALITASVLVWLLVSSKNRHERSGTPAPHGIVRVAAWAAVAALLTAIVANVVGNVSLAEMLTGAVLDSAYVGLALYAGANVVSSDPQPAAGTARDDTLPRDHATRRAAAGKHHQARDVRGAHGVDRRHAERVPHRTADFWHRQGRS